MYKHIFQTVVLRSQNRTHVYAALQRVVILVCENNGRKRNNVEKWRNDFTREGEGEGEGYI